MLELRVDKLLKHVSNNEHEVLSLIHNDPLLSKREVDGLFIANASKELHGPTEPHQQIAKGIVYKINEDGEFETVALPLLKIWNAHEMEQDQAVIINDLINNGSRVLFLEKLDGTMISRFVYNGKVYFSTRGVISGDELAEDYVQKAIDIATEKYPMLMDPKMWSINTLVMELIHPDCRVITNYGDRKDLVLTAVTGCFHDSYSAYWHVCQVAESIGMPVATSYEAKGENYRDQMQYLLDQIAGTDAEGFMMVIEDSMWNHVQYRVKLKGADYIRLLRLMNYCTYKHVVEMILADNSLLSEDNFRAMLAQNSGDDLPQYVMDEYMALHHKYAGFVDGVTKYCEYMKKYFDQIIEGRAVPLNKEDKKWFAFFVQRLADKCFYFKFADGKTVEQVAQQICNDARHDFDYLEKYGVRIVVDG